MVAKMTKIVAIVGRTNVGKSTLFNRLIKKRFSVTSYEPETTRDRLYAETRWREEEFFLVDTAGLNIEIPEETPVEVKKLLESIQYQVQNAISEADILLFIVDAKEGLTAQDKEIAELLRKSQKPIILVANKADNEKIEELLTEFTKVGLGEAFPVSAISGRRSGDLMDKILKVLKKHEKINQPTAGHPKGEKSEVDIAIVGRPNVGKSTLLNKIIGEKRVLVSELPGTTRDTIDVFFKYKNKSLRLVDTGGIRRRGKVKIGIEKFSTLRAIKAISQANIALLLLDAPEGVTKQDLHIAQFILESGRGLMLIINKWDLVEKVEGMNGKREEFLDELRERAKFLPWAPVIFTSALTGKNVKDILDIVLKVSENLKKKISTQKINKVISEAYMENPPKTKGRGQPKIYFSSQTGTSPPTFTLKVNDKSLIHFSYLRYLEKKIRENFDFTGTPIKIELKSNK